MKAVSHIVLSAAAKTFIPLLALFAAALLASGEAGGGAGLAAGLAGALLLALHVLAFGAAAARVAFPEWAARLCAGVGLGVALLGAGAPLWAFAPHLAEAGLFLCVVAAAALALNVVIGRAPTLRDEEW